MWQAGVYSSVMSYLNAIQEAGTDEPLKVAAKMREKPIEDFFSRNGKLREDNLMVHDLWLVQVKKPEESKYPWDYYQILAKIPGDEAFYTDYQGKNLGFGIDNASFLANNAFLADNPAIKTLFEAMSVDVNDGSNESRRQLDGEGTIEDVQRHAAEWIEGHPAEVDSWLAAACAAQ